MTDKKVCVYAICKNELKFLDKWLESMSEADYVVVLDTGSTDGSYEFLKNDPRCTRVEQKVFDPFRFDTSRNESMTLVPEDTGIYVCTDPDELFEPGWCKVLKEGWNDDTERGYYTYAWNHDPSGAPMNVFKYDKIHTKDYHWIYPVHEVLWPNNKSLDDQIKVDFGDKIYLHHWQDISKNRKNYLDMLKISVEENPGDCHVFHLYAREFILQHRNDEARRLFLKLILMKDIGNPLYSEVRLDGYLMLAELAFAKQELDEAIFWCNEFIKLNNSFREPYLMIANIYNMVSQFEDAKRILNLMNSRCKRHYSWVEKSANWSYTDIIVLGDAEFGLKNYEKALECINIGLQHEPDNIQFLKRKVACLELLSRKEEPKQEEKTEEETNTKGTT